MKELLANESSVIGILTLIAGIVYFSKAIYERKSAIKIDGVISSFAEKAGDYFPMVTFQYEGNEYTMRGVNGGSKRKGNVGDKVEVYYRPKNQKYVNLAGSNGDIVVAVVLLVLGAVLCVLGLAA